MQIPEDTQSVIIPWAESDDIVIRPLVGCAPGFCDQSDSMLAVPIKTINLEEGMPTVAQAKARLAGALTAARQQKTIIFKLIHGYGSSGVGGDLRIALQAALRQMMERGEIRECIYGEDWRSSDARAWDLVKRHPEFKADRDFGRGNRGITIVVL